MRSYTCPECGQPSVVATSRGRFPSRCDACKGRATVQVPQPVTFALELWLRTLPADPQTGVRAQIARALAAKLDEAAGDHSGAIAMATAGIAKELRAVIEELTTGDDDADAFLAGLLGAVPNTPDA